MRRSERVQPGPTPLLVLHDPPGDPAWNMALDEALLVTAASRGAALLRFYGWSVPAATFGYSQRYEDLARATRLRPLLRRPTGGGLVPHDHDWTYSLSVPPSVSWYALSAVDSYRAVHAWVVEAFRLLEVTTELAPCCRKEIPGQCFVGHEKDDVLWNGRKIAGAAQRRNQQGLLIQGSVQPPPRLERAAWEKAMRASAPREHFAEIREATLEDDVRSAAETAVLERFGREDFHRRR